MPKTPVCMFCRYRKTPAPCSHAGGDASPERERVAPSGLPSAMITQRQAVAHKEMSSFR